MTASLLRRPRASRTPTTDTTVTATTDGKPGLGARVLQSAVRLSATALMVAAVAAFLFLAVGPRILGYQTSTMLTGSMAPLINPGDVVITVPVPVADLKVGDIITYHIPVDDQRVETHRIIELAVNSQGTATVRTKGDANNGADPWTATLAAGQVDRQVFTVPYLGNAIRALRDPVVLKVLMYGAPAALVVMVLVSIWRKKPDTTDTDTDNADTTDTDGDGDGDAATGTATAAAAGVAGRPLPALDRRPLKLLAKEMNSKDAARKFAASYTRMLPQRVERISQALSTGNNDQAMDAVLSLKISSSMVGALAMEQHCVRLERALALTDHTAAAQAGEDVRKHQPKLEKALGGSTARHTA